MKDLLEKTSNQNKEDLKKSIKNDVLYYTGLLAVIAAIILFNKFVFYFPVVGGISMENTLYDGQRMGCARIHNPNEIERFDIVTASWGDVQIVKRVIGMPGDTILIDNQGIIYLNGEVLKENYGKEPILDGGIAKEGVTLKEGEYFLLGDNRNNSDDSRFHVGIVKFEQLLGKMVTVFE